MRIRQKDCAPYPSERGKIHRLAAAALALLLSLTAVGCNAQRPRENHCYVTEAEISIGSQIALFTGDDLAGADTDFSSSNEDVASVTDGIVTGLSTGETVITSIIGRTLLTTKLTVDSELLGVKSTLADANLCLGNSVTITGGREWTTTDESVLTVTDGTLTAVGVGKTTVGYTAAGQDRTYSVTVMAPEKQGPEEPTEPDDEPEDPPERLLLWADEFDGDTLNEDNWEYQTGIRDAYINMNDTAYGPWLWGNDELQYYTRDAVTLAEGACIITARRQTGLENGRKFTSARITTRDRGYWTYGYFEARMKLPEGTGMWPAFWMLPQPEEGMGTNNRYGGWAANGEIDIMEAKGRLPFEVATTLHFGGNPSTFSTKTTTLDSAISEWHTYGFEWRSDHMAWFVDGVECYRMRNTMWFTSSPAGKDNDTAPFDVPFYLLINLAVGGRYDGSREPAADFVSAQMQIDYVRVYA